MNQKRKKSSITAVYEVDVIENVWWWPLPVLLGAAVSRKVSKLFSSSLFCVRIVHSPSDLIVWRYDIVVCVGIVYVVCCIHTACLCLFSIFFLSSTTMIRSPESRTVEFFGIRHKKKMNKRNFSLAPKKTKKKAVQRQVRRRRNDY